MNHYNYYKPQHQNHTFHPINFHKIIIIPNHHHNIIYALISHYLHITPSFKAPIPCNLILLQCHVHFSPIVDLYHPSLLKTPLRVHKSTIYDNDERMTATTDHAYCNSLGLIKIYAKLLQQA